MVVHPRALLLAALTALLMVALFAGSAFAEEAPAAGDGVVGAATPGIAAEHVPAPIEGQAPTEAPAAGTASLIEPRGGALAEGSLQGSGAGSAAQLAAFPLGLLAIAAGALALNARREA